MVLEGGADVTDSGPWTLECIEIDKRPREYFRQDFTGTRAEGAQGGQAGSLNGVRVGG